jgi:hypothetical protein
MKLYRILKAGLKKIKNIISSTPSRAKPKEGIEGKQFKICVE